MLTRTQKCFNTASGTDCMQYEKHDQAVGNGHTFQYRKRYGLHAIVTDVAKNEKGVIVSIPQAVRIACNVRTRTIRASSSSGFQYRKRYGLHAICVR